MGNDFLIMMLEQGRVISPEKLVQVAKEVSAQVSRASEIITRLREFARKADFSRENITINNPVLNVVKIFGQQLKLQNIALRFLPGKDIPPVLASNNRLEQVFFNLLSNGRDAISQKRETLHQNVGGRISIRSFSKNGLVVVAVSDTGIGIAGDARDKIFEPFFTTKEVGKGMGLGLAIVYEIVVEHGGKIRVHSGTGIGTTFVVRLPHVQESMIP
jgi:C4-dicarboxylate-specific signal transduction histidine kinase